MTGFISGKNVDTVFKWKIDEGQPKSAAGGFQVVQDRALVEVQVQIPSTILRLGIHTNHKYT